LREEPENPTLLMTYALACLQADRRQETRSATQKVLQLEPSEMMRATAYATLISALRGEGKFREGNRMGEQLLAEGVSDFSRAIAYYEIAYNLAEMEEDLDKALDLARRSLDCCPEELKQFSLAALGWVHYKRKEFDEAIDCLSQSTALGEDATTMTHLGMALLASGDDGGAKRVLDGARTLNRGSNDHALSERMMEFMKDSARIVRGARRK
jgi:tetratricopeptide (TPR) repeat protein